MGHPRKARKQYDTPPHPWNAERIKSENKLMVKYGLKNKKEIWKADTLVKKYSREARYLLGFSQDQVEEERNELIGHLTRQGILAENAQLEDILNLTVENVLRRRLQTMVHQKGLSRTAKEARMFVVHGHISMNGKKVDSPSYVVKRGEEDLIDYYSPAIAKQIQEYNAGKQGAPGNVGNVEKPANNSENPENSENTENVKNPENN
ncbi:30S ribosomal protein S4 [Methanobrevibacter sp. TMH8]|uniref:30S ribosomal protein S4 n=1 Tax=Methanobrevibacter sp. TMH8 TaxID=2848611 RepID=UPI001CCA13FE|nr:30S ribosomal protein S4 [Methanobrevibacter sp. TMH8]MBZ9571576.1 30S ribosomal protein S4 [Methanobrevibacter sp. TMH8]